MTVNELLEQKAKLEQQIAEQLRQERASIIAQIKELMATHGLTPADIVTGKSGKEKHPAGRSAGRSAAPGSKIAPKYRDESGNTWTGRGLKPRWLTAALASGRQLAEFCV